MRVLVTGGAGFIGSHLVERLVDVLEGSVIVVDNLRRGSLDNLRGVWKRVSFVHGDICDLRLMRETIRGVDVVFHLAAQSSVMGAEEDTDDCFATNVVGTLNVLRAARDNGIKRLVFTSSREVYGEPERVPVHETAQLRPKNEYGASKAAAEAYCQAFGRSGLKTVILRLANVYGPRDAGRVIPTFLERAFGCGPLTVYGGDQVLDFVWIDSVVNSLIRAGIDCAPDRPVNVGSGTPVTILSLARRVVEEAATGAPIQILPARGVEVSRFVADTSEMQAVLGIPAEGDPLKHLRSLIK